VAEDGKPYVQLHKRKAGDRNWLWHAESGPINLLLPNLQASGVGYVLIAKGDSPAWPEQHQLLAQSGLVELVYEDAQAAIWRLGR
jgi:hypothetical protein